MKSKHFVKEMRTALLNIGAVETENALYPLRIQTIGGELGLSIDLDARHYACLNGKFMDVIKAKKELPELSFNRHSGKFNQTLLSHKFACNEIVEHFATTIEELLPTEVY